MILTFLLLLKALSQRCNLSQKLVQLRLQEYNTMKWKKENRDFSGSPCQLSIEYEQ